METLLEDYKRKLSDVIEQIKECQSLHKFERLEVRAACYRSFILEIEMAIKRKKIINQVCYVCGSDDIKEYERPTAIYVVS